jgi:regulator of protease activity HflC (stomatin/prohibitin superfamily)
MSQDQQTYKRAATAALAGLIFQFVLALALALLGLYAQSTALHAASWYFFGGLPIWLILWVLFNQHRLERAEALEAEQLGRTDAQAAAIFDEAGQQLMVARNRLTTLYKFVLPIVSLFSAAYLLALGGTLLYQAIDNTPSALRAAAFSPRADAAIVSVAALVIAFVGFLVARSIAGMTKVSEWSLLRGGAGYLMGNVVVTVLVFAAALAHRFGQPDGFMVLAAVVPGIMILLGIETVLSFVLGAYRPRRPGEIVRPAFDSRILGWLTRPESLGKIVGEAINYQFGFEISRSWFYQLLARAVTPLVACGAVVLIAMSSIVIVAPQQEAVISSNGRFDRVAQAGLTFKWPWPIGRVQRRDVYRVQQLTIGSAPEPTQRETAILWTNQHAKSPEQYLVTAPAAVDDGTGQAVAAGLVGATVTIKYRVADLQAYLTAAYSPPDKPDLFLHNLAERSVNAYFVTHDIDTLLAKGRTEAGDVLRREIQGAVDRERLGLAIVFVGLTTIHPPQDEEVAAKFHEQIDAQLERQTALEKAEQQAVTILAEVAGSREKALRINGAIQRLEQLKHEIEGQSGGDNSAVADQLAEQELEIEKLLDAAGGKAAQMIHQARAYRWQYALAERARAMRTASLYEQYRQAPEYFRKRLYLMTLAESLKDRRKIILTGEQKEPAVIRLNLEDQASPLGSLFSETK